MVWCGVVWCGVVQCSAVQCSAVQCSAVQCSAVYCSVVWCSVVLCCFVLFCVVLCCFVFFLCCFVSFSVSRSLSLFFLISFVVLAVSPSHPSWSLSFLGPTWPGGCGLPASMFGATRPRCPSWSITAVICEADDPCFGNTAYDPEPSFAMSPRSTSIFEIVGPTPNSGDDRGTSTMQSFLFCPHSLLQRSPHLCC